MHLDRRQFLGTTGAGALTLLAAPQAIAAGATEPEPAFPTGTLRIKRVFLAKPVPSWPTPKLSVPGEMKRLNGILAKLRKDLPDVEFAGDDLLLRRPEDLDNVKEKIGDVDAVLVFNLTSSVGVLLQGVAQLGRPTILFAQPYSGHDWSSVAAMQKAGMKIECLATSDFHEIVDAMRPIRAMRRMKESRIVYLNTSQAGKAYADKLKAAWGTDLVSTDPNRLSAVCAEVNEKAAQDVAKRWMQGADRIVEPSREEIVRSARFYLAMRRILADEKAQAITINCLGLFAQGRLPAYPCLGFCQLNNDLFVGACEGDLDSTATMLLFRYLINKPGFISDPVIDTSKNIVIHAHCVSATKMDGPAGETAPYIIRSHLEDDKGAVLQVRMRVGQPITMAKLVAANDLMLLSTAKIVDTPAVERACRTKITTRVPDARKILEGYAHGLHRVIFYGDHVRDIKRLSRFVPMQVVEEG